MHILQLCFHALGVGNHVGRYIPFVELHAFDYFLCQPKRLGFFNGDDAVFSNFFHDLSNEFPNLRILRRNSADLRDLLIGLHRLGHALQFLHDSFYCFFNPMAHHD